MYQRFLLQLAPATLVYSWISDMPSIRGFIMPRPGMLKLSHLAASLTLKLIAFARINAWYGIRYAQPPTGPLRWRAPRDIEAGSTYSESKVIGATEIGPPCVQGAPLWLGPFSATGIEDCLLLDILVPTNPVSSDLPVMVQIHGGGTVTTIDLA